MLEKLIEDSCSRTSLLVEDFVHKATGKKGRILDLITGNIYPLNLAVSKESDANVIQVEDGEVALNDVNVKRMLVVNHDDYGDIDDEDIKAALREFKEEGVEDIDVLDGVIEFMAYNPSTVTVRIVTNRLKEGWAFIDPETGATVETFDWADNVYFKIPGDGPVGLGNKPLEIACHQTPNGYTLGFAANCEGTSGRLEDFGYLTLSSLMNDSAE